MTATTSAYMYMYEHVCKTITARSHIIWI